MHGLFQPIRFDSASLRYLSQLGQRPHSAHSESSGFSYQAGVPFCIAQQRLESTHKAGLDFSAFRTLHGI